MQPHPRSGEQGTILIVAMILTTLAIVIVADMRTVSRVEWEAATNADVDFILDAALRAGYQIAEAYLRQDYVDSPDVDHLLEEWADPGGISRTLDPTEYGELAYQASRGGPAGAASEPDEASIPKLRIFIEDEDRKYPLPLLITGADSLKERRRKSFAKLIQNFRRGTIMEVDGGTALNYANAIANFIERRSGESSGVVPRAETKSGMIISTSDLGLIPDIPQEVIFDAVDFKNAVVMPGLYRYVTAFTDLAVNINTAPVAVLTALPRPEEESVGFDIAQKRGQNQEKFMESEKERIRQFGEDPRRPGRAAAPPGGAQGMLATGGEAEEEEVGYWENVDDIKDQVPTLTNTILSDFRLNATVTSKTFSIYVEASMRGIRRVRRTVVRREEARFVPILTELVTWPRYREPTDDEQQEAEYGR